MGCRGARCALLIVALLLSACAPYPPPPAFLSPLVLPSRKPQKAAMLAAIPVFRYYLPIITAKGLQSPEIVPALACGMSLQSQRMADLLTGGKWQGRSELFCSIALVLAAQWRADNMVDFRYFDHTSTTGESPNEVAERFGCEHGYGEGNAVESIAAGYPTPELAMLALLASPPHFAHLAGSGDFFRGQDSFGVGYAQHPDEAADTKYVLLISECE